MAWRSSTTTKRT